MRNSNGNTFSFIPHVCYFSYHASNAASKAPRRLTTLFCTKMRGKETQSQEHQHPCLSNLYSTNSKASLLLYTCEVIYLIKKGVISPYVHEQGGILLKFNILRLHTYHIALELNAKLLKAVLK